MLMEMDVYNMKQFPLSVLILLFIYDITARDDDQWSRKRAHIWRVTDSSCGQSHLVKNEIFLLYDGGFLSEPCVINFYSSHSSRHSKLCIKLDKVFSYGENFECKNIFRFYFGGYPAKNITKFLSCSEIHQEVCDVVNTAYAVFSSEGVKLSDTKIKVQMKISTKTKHSKHTSNGANETKPLLAFSAISRRGRSWSDWDAWNSWNSWSNSRSRSGWGSWSSWYSTYEREKEEKKKMKIKGGIIVLSVLGSFGVLVCLIVTCCIAKAYAETPRRPGQNAQTQNYSTVPINQTATSEQGHGASVTSAEILPPVPEVTETRGDTNISSASGYNVRYHGHTPSGVAIENLHIPSAPPEEKPENEDFGLPPPSYSSLFPSK